VINSILTVLIILVAIVYSMLSDDLTTYEGVTFSTATLIFFLWCYALFQFGIDLYQSIQRPMYYSSTLFPILKYSQIDKDVLDHYEPTMAWIAGLVLMSLWAFLTNY
jgi:hypothetical protein